MPIIHLVHQWGRCKTRLPIKEHFDHHFADGLFHWSAIILISPNQWANGHLSISASLNLANGLVDWCSWVQARDGTGIQIPEELTCDPKFLSVWLRSPRRESMSCVHVRVLLWLVIDPSTINSQMFVPNYPIDRPPAHVFVSGSILRAFKGLHRWDHQ